MSMTAQKGIGLILSMCLSVLVPHTPIFAAGEVYLVLGSDTAIWDGMDVGRFHCYYNADLYTNPLRNAYRVMDPTFRGQIVDSYGTPLKMTWWMMAGNIFRYAMNKNVPLANIMTLYLMNKYHGVSIQRYDDELSLHYHTFTWSDYDRDGKYWWNQARNFLECKDDFDVTLAQFLLEENIFPVSFRSGWHYMDNEWQQYLDTLLPYSLHNDWPNVHNDTSEPLDNIFDWSQAPREFVPYHPSRQNYQVPGDGRGWNVRSVYIGAVSQNLMDSIFDQANQGIDQVACIWAHLPESDFLDNIQKIDVLAHTAAARYPEVKFRYCTAVEAMQRWQKTTDFDVPELSLEEDQVGDRTAFVIRSSEPIFQPQPFIAIKDIYERYFTVPCVLIGTNLWRTTESFTKDQLAKVGVAVCDTVGNLATQFLQYLPDDIYIDNRDGAYAEVAGSWLTSSESAWGVDSRVATLGQNDSAKVRWEPDIRRSGRYNVFIQVPPAENQASHTVFRIYSNAQLIDTTVFEHELPAMDWVYVGTVYLNASGDDYLEMVAYGVNQVGKTVVADVAKFSALLRARDLDVAPTVLSFGEISQDDTVCYDLKVTNRGVEELTLLGLSSANQTVTSPVHFPKVVPPMKSVRIPIRFHSPTIGLVCDTLYISSDDPVKPRVPIAVTADVQSYFVLVDNEDSLSYSEEGVWYYSVAQAYGPTSRYAYLGSRPGASARFFTRLKKSGVYEIFEIVPETVNSANSALYVLNIGNVAVDSVYIDQNAGSGNWVRLGRHYLPAGLLVEVKVMDTGKSTQGVVIRADAIKFSLIQEMADVKRPFAGGPPMEFWLKQNYPNPFNPRTTIEFYLPRSDHVTITIFDLSGRLVTTISHHFYKAGWNKIEWDGTNRSGQDVASGVYVYAIRAGPYTDSKKMLKLR